MPTEYNRTLLPLIDQALASPGWLPPIPPLLQEAFAAERLLQCRLFNRRILIALTLLFDAYWLNEIWTSPEIVTISGMLRFGLMTPAVLLFMALDRRDTFGRAYPFCLLLLTITPGAITAVLCVRTTSPMAFLDISATPLIMLGSGMAVRMPPREFLANASITPALFIGSLFYSQAMPTTQIGSLSLIELSIAAAAIGFNLQLEWRDRRMFLLNTADQIIRARLAATNAGLVRKILTDPLTGITNRRGFDETLAEFWRQAAATGRPIGLIMADLDHFKRYNDHYGHQQGDDCLRRVAARMATLIRIEDVLTRYGGEEFAVILPDADLQTVQTVAERMRGGVAALRLRHGGLQPPGIVTLSLGLASLHPSPTDDPDQLIAEADMNLYAAKRAGRNRSGHSPQRDSVTAPENSAIVP